MFAQDYLSLRLNRLKQPEQCSFKGEGLAFIFLSGGAGQFVSNSVLHRLGPGDVLVLDNRLASAIAPAEGKEIVFWYFHARLEHFFPLFAADEICLLQELHEYLKVPRLYASTTVVAAECHKLISSAPPHFNLDHRTHILMVAAVVLSAELANVRPQKNGYVRVEDHLKKVFETLSVDEILNLSVDELAQRFSCSRRHLNRLFHQHLGLSVSSLRMEMRLLKAATLLKDSSAKVINVAADCGFNHLGLFNICFKRRFGASPGQWRKAPDDNGAELSSLSPANIKSHVQTSARAISPSKGSHHRLGEGIASAAKQKERQQPQAAVQKRGAMRAGTKAHSRV